MEPIRQDHLITDDTRSNHLILTNDLVPHASATEPLRLINVIFELTALAAIFLSTRQCLAASHCAASLGERPRGLLLRVSMLIEPL